MSNPVQRKASLPTGFCGSYDEYSGDTLDLNDLLIQAPAATFFMRVGGDAMAGDRIVDGDTLVVNRALTARADDIVVAGEFCVRKLLIENGQPSLFRNDHEPVYLPNAGEPLDIWGVISSSITQCRSS
jgi:DNA polymerase V